MARASRGRGARARKPGRGRPGAARGLGRIVVAVRASSSAVGGREGVAAREDVVSLRGGSLQAVVPARARHGGELADAAIAGGLGASAQRDGGREACAAGRKRRGDSVRGRLLLHRNLLQGLLVLVSGGLDGLGADHRDAVPVRRRTVDLLRGGRGVVAVEQRLPLQRSVGRSRRRRQLLLPPLLGRRRRAVLLQQRLVGLSIFNDHGRRFPSLPSV
mmetsp:Transcript_42256/g.89868  ORF Transcript_42256/g.89868 Transcript_42256/m.89868 type:complete len:217 (+) Transcript_42256:220-870(+)